MVASISINNKKSAEKAFKIRRNTLKKKMKEGQKTWGVSFGFKSLSMIELSAKLSYDYIFVEGEHGVISPQDIEEICILADALALPVMARIPRIEASTILQYLERGVMTIRAPHVSTREEAEALVRYCKFPPGGVRGFSNARIADYDTPDDVLAYAASVDEEIMTIAMIEDELGMKNLSAILAVEGLDAVTIGPYDFAQALGEKNPESPKAADAMRRIADQVRAAGKIYEPDCTTRLDALQLFKLGAAEYLRRQKLDQV